MAYLRAYLRHLEEVFPVYVTSDLGEEKVRVCIKEYPALYRILESSQEDLEIAHGELLPNLAYFNDCFPEDIAAFIERTTAGFVGQRKPN